MLSTEPTRVWRTRRQWLWLRQQPRMLTAGLRAFPAFIIIGAQRSGTTSLYSYLVSHPQVVAPLRKEVHYFDLNYRRGLRWYRSFFPLCTDLRPKSVASTHLSQTGEASPYYLFHPLVPLRVARDLPSVRLVVILRHPVERAYSHYRHEVAQGRERHSFEEAIAAEASRCREDFRLLGLGQDPGVAHRRYSYISRGLYAEQLERWFAHFPREQVLVVSSDDLQGEPLRVYRRTTAFLGLSRQHPPPFRAQNVGQPAVLPRAAASTLAEYFADPNQRLFELIGQELWAESSG